MPFKRVAINQGRQPRALVKGAIGGQAGSAGGDFFAGGRKWRRSERPEGSARASLWSAEAVADEVEGFALMGEE